MSSIPGINVMNPAVKPGDSRAGAEARSKARAFGFMSPLSGSAWAEVAEALVERTWPEGAVIFRPGQECRGIYVVRSGLIKVYVTDLTGREQIVHLRGAGSPLSLLPLLDGGPYETSAQALRASRTVFLEISAVLDLLRRRPDFLTIVLAQAGRDLRRMITLAADLGLKSVNARVARHLLEQATASGALEEASEFRLGLTQTELAKLVGTTRESISRVFAELRSEGMIAQRSAHVRILNPERLARLAGSTARI